MALLFRPLHLPTKDDLELFYQNRTWEVWGAIAAIFTWIGSEVYSSPSGKNAVASKTKSTAPNASIQTRIKPTQGDRSLYHEIHEHFNGIQRFLDDIGQSFDVLQLDRLTDLEKLLKNPNKFFDHDSLQAKFKCLKSDADLLMEFLDHSADRPAPDTRVILNPDIFDQPQSLVEAVGIPKKSPQYRLKFLQATAAQGKQLNKSFTELHKTWRTLYPDENIPE